MKLSLSFEAPGALRSFKAQFSTQVLDETSALTDVPEQHLKHLLRSPNRAKYHFVFGTNGGGQG